MGTIQSANPSIRQPFSRTAPSSTLDSRINAFSIEVDFYYRLLSWCLLSCREEQRFAIERLRAEVEALRDTELPALASAYRRSVNGEQMPARPGQAVTVTAMKGWICDLENAFQALKLHIQQRFGEFVHVCIW